MREETVKITCDRCGKEINGWFDKGFRLHKRKIIMTRGSWSNQEEQDLCEDCYKSLRHWYFTKGETK